MMNNGMKWSAGLLAAAILVGGTALPAGTGHAASAVVKKAEAAQVPVSLKWKGKLTSEKGFLSAGRVYVPVTFLRDTVGLKLTYDAKSHVYSIGEGYRQLNLDVSEYAPISNMNGYYLNDEYNFKMVKGHLYVPYKLLNDYMGMQSNWDAKSKQLSMGTRAENAIKITTVKVDKKFKGAKVNFEYPEVSGMASETAQKAINAALKSHMDTFVAAAEKEVKKRTAKENEYEYDSSYVITFNEKDVISLVTTQSSYSSGAHGYTRTDGFTFSLKDGKQLALGDLLKSNPNYKKQLNQELGKKLKANTGYLGGFKGLTSDKNFFLKPNTLTIYFLPYEYTAYAEGTVQYDFPLSELTAKGANPFQ